MEYQASTPTSVWAVTILMVGTCQRKTLHVKAGDQCFWAVRFYDNISLKFVFFVVACDWCNINTHTIENYALKKKGHKDAVAIQSTAAGVKSLQAAPGHTQPMKRPRPAQMHLWTAEHKMCSSQHSFSGDCSGWMFSIIQFQLCNVLKYFPFLLLQHPAHQPD